MIKTLSEMKFITILYSLLMLSLTAFSQNITSGFSSPESVASNGKRFFVSNIGPGKNKIARDSDGFISEIFPNGKIKTKHFLPTTGVMHSPHGLVVIKNMLYVADEDKVQGFNINSRAKVFDVSTGTKTGLLNDIEKINDSLLVVSDIFKDVIYCINLHTKSISDIGHVPGPNGLLYDATNNLLYVCTVGHHSNGQGKLFVKSGFKSKNEWKLVSGSPDSGVFDGIAFLDSDHILISDWITYPSSKGRLFVYSLKNRSYISYPLKSPEPADMYVDKNSHDIFLPQTAKDRVIIFKTNDLKNKKLERL